MINLNAPLLGLFFCLFLSSCKNDFDKEGRLHIESLTSSTGTLKFTPMLRSDSASVLSFIPDTFFYDGKPFTGAVVRYADESKLQLEGHMKNGLMDSTWSYYYLSGGLRMKGNYRSGWDIGRNGPATMAMAKKIEKVGDPYGFMLSRIEYYDNGQLKSLQQVKHPDYGSRMRRMQWNRKGELYYIYVEDSILKRFSTDETEKVGEDLFIE
ncbi:MAG: hypothetical protein IPH78_03435 [Bacteroidetes bacterium]|nr:hypothetical protein [Bacteroidota bacterium]